MVIDIDRLPEDGLHVSREFEFLSEDLVEENAVFLQPVEADFLVKKIDDEIYIKGKLSTRLSLICCRCLSPFEYDVDSHFDHVYLPEELDGYKEQLEPEDMTARYYASRQIDLKEIILEQLNFTFPTRPLCSDKCQGICPVCGKIVNEGDCTCSTSETDPRLEKFSIFVRDKR